MKKDRWKRRKKVYRRIAALVMALSMIAGLLPTDITAAERKEGESQSALQDISDVTMEGSDSVGMLLADALSEAEEESSELEGQRTYISDLEISGSQSAVTYFTEQDAEVVVAIYEEETKQMLASGKVSVSNGSETQTAIVTIEGDMPQYYNATAFMLDAKSHEPLCEAYSTNLYSRAMQELEASTVADYNVEQVLNLDEDDKTNFVVYSEGTKIIAYSEDANQVTDNGDGTYVIANADNNFTSLRTGDIFSYCYEDGSVLIAKVKSVSVDGTTVIITEDADIDLESVFDYVKIEGGIKNPPEQETEIDSVGAGTLESSASFTASVNKKIDGDKAFDESKESSFSIKGSLKIDGYVKAYISLKSQYIEAKISISLSGEMELKGSCKKKEVELLPTAPYLTICPGVFMKVNPVFVVEFSASLKTAVTVSAAAGIKYDSSSGAKNTSEKPSLKGEFKAEGSVFVGFKPGAEVFILSDAIGGASISAEAGLKLTASYTKDVSNGADSRHLCNACLSGKLSAEFNIAAKIEVAGNAVFEHTIVKLTFPDLLECYYSADYGEFAWKSCPHKAYLVTAKVKDEQGNPISGVTIWEDGSDFRAVTNSKGTAELYLVNGIYNLIFSKGKNNATLQVRVDGKARDAVVTMKNEEADKTYRVRIKAKDKEGNGIGGVTVTGDGLDLNAVTDSDGMAEFYLPDGTYNLAVTKGENTTTLQLVVNGEEQDVEITMENEDVEGDKTYQVRIKVKDEEGNGIGGVTVTGDGLYSGAVTDSSGIAEFYLPDGTYNLAFTKGENTTTLQLVMDGKAQDVEITMENEDAEIVASGKFGKEDGLFWELNKNGLLVISSEYAGNIEWQTVRGKLPWKDYLKSIKEVIIKEGLESIGEDAFYGCNLESITLPSSVTSIGDYAFGYCSCLQSITLPPNLTNIGDYAFWHCESLGSITLPSNLTNIGDYAFCCCTRFRSITLPSGITSISKGTFSSCSGLTSVTLPVGVTSIGVCAFDFCRGLKNITLPPSLMSIGDSAFSGCSGLTGIMIPSGITSISKGTFSSCSRLTSIILPSGVASIGANAFSDCRGLTSITLPSGLTNIGNSAFSDCSGLTSITLPSGLTDIEAWAFSNCSGLTSITFPLSIRSIRSNAFYKCNELSDIYYEGSEEEWAAISIGDMISSAFYQAAKHYYYKEPSFGEGGRNSLKPIVGVTAISASNQATSAHASGQADILALSESRNASGNAYTGTISASSTQKTTSFTGLVPNNLYVVLIVKQSDAQDLLAAGNLLYIAQGYADASGTLALDYIPRTEDPSVALAYGYQETKVPSGGGEEKDPATDNPEDDNKPGGSDKNPGSEITGGNTQGNQTQVKPPASKPDYTPAAKISTVTLKKTSYTYNGKKQTPNVTVRAGNTALVKNKDYTISYANNVKVGTATVTVKGIGKYSGTMTRTFKILPKGTSISGSIKAKSKGFTVKWKKQKSASGYQVQYSTSKKFTKKTTMTKTVKKKSTIKLNVGKLKANKKYYVRVRAYQTVKGKKYESAWSKAKTVKVKK